MPVERAEVADCRTQRWPTVQMHRRAVEPYPVRVPSSRENLNELLKQVNRQRLAEDMLDGVQRELSTYQAMSSEELADVLDACRLNLELAWRYVVDGNAPSEAELDTLRDSARRRAGEAIRLEDMLQAYRIAARAVIASMRSQAGGRHEHALRAVADALGDYLDLVTTAVVRGYLDERVRLNSEQDRRASALIQRLASGATRRAEDHSLAEHLGFELRDHYVAFAATLNDGGAGERATLASKLRSSGLVAYVDLDRVVGLAHGMAELKAVVRGSKAEFVVAEVSHDEVRDGLEDVVLIARSTSVRSAGSVRSIDDCLPELLLARSPRLAKGLRAIIEDALVPELERTLQALFANKLDRASTAKALGIHRNTLANRIARIVELTGLSLDTPRGAMMLQLAGLATQLDLAD
jgi:PucR C-terminal helix-turn-helix domain